jgi:hypothetical protein
LWPRIHRGEAGHVLVQAGWVWKILYHSKI